MIDDISEKFSENKRGRPRLLRPEFESAFRDFFPKASDRTFTNNVHAMQALKVLKDEKEFSWLFETHESGNWKRHTLFSEIGRLRNPDVIRQVARDICKEKPKVKEGVILVRRYRLKLMGKEPVTKGDQDTLEDELIDLVDNFMLRFPDTDHQTILQALSKVYNLVVDLD